MKKIMIVEDDLALYNVYSMELKIKGYEVVNVPDGLAAIEAFRTQRPDLVLLDLMLPGRNGMQILEELKSDEELMATKVVMLTNYGDDNNVTKALRLGAEDYMLKYNIVPSELSEKVAHYLGDTSSSIVNIIENEDA
ncbi:MAG: response regulator [Patescibacteria group bacterium]|jgi:DNA-binding response OmpR family regulator